MPNIVCSALATHETVLNNVLEATDADGNKLLLPAHELAWGIVSTTDSSSRIHVDAEGLGTATLVMNREGKKFWVVARPKVPNTKVRGSKTDVYDKFDDELLDPSMRYEGVLLTEGTCL